MFFSETYRLALGPIQNLIPGVPVFIYPEKSGRVVTLATYLNVTPVLQMSGVVLTYSMEQSPS